MTDDPRRSRTYKNTIKKAAKRNQGAFYYVGEQRYTIHEMAAMIGKDPNRTRELLRTWIPEKLLIKFGVEV
jgi:hypothetical protein